MRIWEIEHSTNVERVLLALAHKGLEVEHVAIPNDDRSEVVRVSGQELVPVLETDDGTILNDSPAILRYIEDTWPDPPLWPREPDERAAANVFVDWFNHVWKRRPNMLFTEERKPSPDETRMAEWSREMADSLATFAGLLERRDYLLGDELGIADVVAFPFLRYPLLGVPEDDPHRFHALLVEHMPLRRGDFPRLRDWARRVDERPRA